MKHRIATQSQIKSQLEYNPETGDFIRIVKSGGAKVGDKAGCISNESGYVMIGVLGVQCRAHRLAYVYMMGDVLSPSDEIDHINGIRSDNRWCNLRIATSSQQKMNTSTRSDNNSGCKGVSFRRDTNKWHARIVIHGKTLLLGNFVDINDAVRARKQAEIEIHNKYARAS